MKIIFVSSHLPRECGIATYTDSLSKAIKASGKDVQMEYFALNDKPGYKYPPNVIGEIDAKDPESYRKAAQELNASDADLISIQHEFGIYGGFNGKYLLELVSNLTKPTQITLHTVPIHQEKPFKINPKYYKFRTKLLRKAFKYVDGIFVMTETAQKYLEKHFKDARGKVSIVRHGAPEITVKMLEQFRSEKSKIGINPGERIITTFGLIAPRKGLEFAIKAVAKTVKLNPTERIKYLIAGRIHPYKPVEYLNFLKEVARKNGIEKNVVFDTRFLPDQDVYRYLANTDIYVTPYFRREQASSGSLSYAIAAGCCVVSTPYVFARDLLLNNKVGLLADFKSSSSLAKDFDLLIKNPKMIERFKQNSLKFGQSIAWPKIGGIFVENCLDVLKRSKNG
jgi:glycosyltransferase involved in cell wall biosynthesis